VDFHLGDRPQAGRGIRTAQRDLAQIVVLKVGHQPLPDLQVDQGMQHLAL